MASHSPGLRCETTDTSPWYALHVRSNFEHISAAHLASRRVEYFLPTYRQRKQWKDRLKELELALFPGYLFCRFGEDRKRDVITTPGVVDVVSFGGIFAPVSDEEV